MLYHSWFIFLLSKKKKTKSTIVHLLASLMAISIPHLSRRSKAESKFRHLPKTNSMRHIQHQLIQDTPKARSKVYLLTKPWVDFKTVLYFQISLLNVLWNLETVEERKSLFFVSQHDAMATSWNQKGCQINNCFVYTMPNNNQSDSFIIFSTNLFSWWSM